MDEKVWKKDLKELEIDMTLKADNRVNDLMDRKLERFQGVQAETLKAKDKLIKVMQEDIRKLKLFLVKDSDLNSSSEGALASDESGSPASEIKVTEVVQAKVKPVPTKRKVVPTKVIVVPAEVESEAKIVKIKKRVKKSVPLLSEKCRLGFSGEGEKVKPVSSKPRMVIEQADDMDTSISDRILKMSVENPKKDLGLSLIEARSFEFSSGSPGLYPIDTQQSDVNDPLLDEIMGDQLEISEFEREEALDKMRLERVNREVIEEEKKARQKARTDRAKVVKKEKMAEIERKLIGKVEKRNQKRENVKDRLGSKGKKRK